MLKLDLIKFIAPIDCITNLRHFKVQYDTDTKLITKEEYKSKSPFSLHIKLDHANKQLVIEFTAKILKDNYYQLINKTNFKECLAIINDLLICDLNIDRICNEGVVVKIHVTEDATYAEDFFALTKTAKNEIANYNKYKTNLLKNGNFIIEKNVITKQKKKRLTIYQKFREMQLSHNKGFLDSVEDTDKLLQRFRDKVRFELILTSQEQIRKSLFISNTDILTVLNSEATPIHDFIDNVFVDSASTAYKTHSKKEYENFLVLKENDFDLEKVEAVMRNKCSPKTHISQVMKPYRELLTKVKNTDDRDYISVKKTLIDMLNASSTL
jgi:hypothetical protein